jgi:CRP/FNR family cyclic AMP-dependent transcriptional regulator
MDWLTIMQAWPFSFLSRLPPDLLIGLFRDAEHRRLPEGEILFRAGDPPGGCFRIDSGVVKIVLPAPDGKERPVTRLEDGAIVGELSMIDGAPRSATAVALTDCALSYVTREDFDAFALQNPYIYDQLLRLLAGRLRETSQRLLER